MANSAYLITPEQLATMIGNPAVSVIDCRFELLDPDAGRRDYDAGHIPGALSVPLGRLKELLSELPRDQEFVAYCRGPYCVLAVHAVEILRKNGFKAIRLEEGVQDWMAMGFSIAVGEETKPLNKETTI